MKIKLPAALPKGQVITRGMLLVKNQKPINPPTTYAIVGGTEAYELARGQVIETGLNNRIRTLKITF
jgi:hypothetical protein